ncbi:MAG: metal ABC transporter substrate-binding protein [Actinobacteria bacterium]|nr:metal ABC transporter substrate-binding protein [Cyanobacteriota bacterium]MCL5772566.1 metal ABC transporter substrate-binding protein [Actinomycetota bacterium]
MIKKNKIKKFYLFPIVLILFLVILNINACKNSNTESPINNISDSKNNITKVNEKIKDAIAVETFLADISQNIAGERLDITPLIPIGIDPHEFEPTPDDFTKISKSQLIIINGGGLEGWLEKALKNAGSNAYIINASEDLGDAKNPDPHYWLDPNYVIDYVKNIRDGLIKEDPQGKDIYLKNSENYISRLKDLDNWIKNEVSIIPEDKRLLVTNHESMGYFAKRYGFKIIGTIIPNVSSDASVSAKEFADLVEKIKASGAKAIFLETGSNPVLAKQLADETGIKVIYNLYTHSLSDKNGEAPTYIDMMKFITKVIVDSLK